MKALGRALYDGYKFKRENDHRFQVYSPRGQGYTTTKRYCTCPDAKMRGGSHNGRCKHSIMVEELKELLGEL